MQPDTFALSLREFSHRASFKPFSVELVSGRQFTVDHPEALVFRAGLAVAPNGRPSISDHEGVARLVGAPDANTTAPPNLPAQERTAALPRIPMKTFILIFLAAFFTAGCDMDKVTGVQSEPATPVAAPKPAATPTPKPKQGDWMYKNYKNPLDPKKK